MQKAIINFKADFSRFYQAIRKFKISTDTQFKLLYYLLAFLTVILFGLTIQENVVIPVKNAKPADWNQDAFWFEPWGPSGVHKGIDIFARKGTLLLSATQGIVVYKGVKKFGGNVLMVLGPKWKLHYYAHLHSANVRLGQVVRSGQPIGRVGNSGNARGKQPHLHYSITSLIPRIWKSDDSSQGWKKAFYIDPNKFLLNSLRKLKYRKYRQRMHDIQTASN